MTSHEFKIELKKLNLQLYHQIILSWDGTDIKKSEHIVTKELLTWIYDSNKESTGLIANPLEDEINISEFNIKEISFGGESFNIVEGYLPVKTIPLTLKLSEQDDETYIEEAALGHVVAIALK